MGKILQALREAVVIGASDQLLAVWGGQSAIRAQRLCVDQYHGHAGRVCVSWQRVATACSSLSLDRSGNMMHSMGAEACTQASAHHHISSMALLAWSYC